MRAGAVFLFQQEKETPPFFICGSACGRCLAGIIAFLWRTKLDTSGKTAKTLKTGRFDKPLTVTGS